MTPGMKRSFLLGMTGVAVVGGGLCISLVGLGNTSQANEIAVMMGLAFAACLVLAFAGFTVMDRKWWRIPAAGGIGLAAVSLLLAVLFFYLQIRPIIGYVGGRTQQEYLFHARVEDCLLTVLLTSGVLSLVSCVGSLRMKAGAVVLQWLSGLALWATYLLSMAGVWSSRHDPLQDKLLVVCGLAAGASFVAVLMLYWFFGLKLPDPLTTYDQKLFVRCPRCLEEQEVPMGESCCAECYLRFTIDMEEPNCPGCGYCLRGLTYPVCPECGREIVSGAVAAAEPV